MIDLAVSGQSAGAKWPGVPEGIDASSFVTRVIAGFGHLDIVDVGGRLVLLHPGIPDPAAEAAYLEVVDQDTLTVLPSAGYEVAGETVHLERNPDGSISSVVAGGMRSWPLDAFLARRRTQMARRPADSVPDTDAADGS